MAANQFPFKFPQVPSVLIAGCLLASGLGLAADNGVLAPGATLKKLGDGYLFTEGPATDAHGNVYFTDQPNDRIVRWDAATGTFTDWLRPAGRANGMAFDRAGNLLACADDKNELWSISPDRQIGVLVRDHDGKLLNGPNDLWIHPDGQVYFTDPLYRRPYWKRDPAPQQAGQYVYLLKPGGTPQPVATDLKQPNGIIGTPDGRTLYVADIGAGRTYAYAIGPDGQLTDKRLFCDLGSDGMTLDVEGNVYLTGRGVSVFNAEGRKIEQVDVPEGWTANVTFGGADRDLLFITAGPAVYGIKTRVKGVR